MAQDITVYVPYGFVMSENTECFSRQGLTMDTGMYSSTDCDMSFSSFKVTSLLEVLPS